MTTYPCPKGHSSADPDFCSECGAKIAGVPSKELNPFQNPAGKASACPDCGMDRVSPDAIYCEVCGYNFVTGAHGEIAVSPGPVASESVTTPKSWSLVISVEATAKDAASPSPPTGFEPVTIPLLTTVSLIGRCSAARAIDPEIVLDFDEAVSHRHAILTRADDGSLSLRDIGSSNGTELNGTAVPAMTDHVLKDGDELTLGHWTRLTVKST